MSPTVPRNRPERWFSLSVTSSSGAAGNDPASSETMLTDCSLEVGDADEDHALGATVDPHLRAGEGADVERSHVVDGAQGSELLSVEIGRVRSEPGGVHGIRR